MSSSTCFNFLGFDLQASLIWPFFHSSNIVRFELAFVSPFRATVTPFLLYLAFYQRLTRRGSFCVCAIRELSVAATSIAMAVSHALSSVSFLSFNSSFLIDSLARPDTNLSRNASFKKSPNG